MAKQPLTNEELIRQMAEDLRRIRRRTPGEGELRPWLFAFVLIMVIPVVLVAMYQVLVKGEFSW